MSTNPASSGGPGQTASDTARPATREPNTSAAPSATVTKSIFTSRTFAGLALIVLPIVAEKAGFHLDDTATQKIVEELFQAAGCLLAAYGRLKASKTIRIPTPSNTSSILLALAAALALLLSACATTTRSGRVTNAVLATLAKFAGKVVLATVADAASDKAAGLKVDLAHSASEGLWTNLETAITAADITRIVDAWSGGSLPSAPLAAQFTTIAPRTLEERRAVVEAMARGISDAAQQLDTQRGDGKAITLPGE